MKDETKKSLKNNLKSAVRGYNNKKLDIPEKAEWSDLLGDSDKVDEFDYCQSLFDLAIDFYQVERESDGYSFPEDSFATELLKSIDPEEKINDDFVGRYNSIGNLKDTSDVEGNRVDNSFSRTQNEFEQLFSNANFKKANEAFAQIGDLINSKAEAMVLQDKLPEDIEYMYFENEKPIIVTKDGSTLNYADYSKRFASGQVADEIESEMEER